MSDNSENPYATEHTQVFDASQVNAGASAAPVRDRYAADDLATQRAEEKAARDRQLGKVERDRGPEPAAPVVHKPTTDKFAASFGLFLLRLVTAGIMGVHGVQKLTNIAGTEAMEKAAGVPYPHWAAWTNGVAEVLIAVALLFGLFTRLAGLGITIITTLALVMVLWRHQNPFKSGQSGFTGELELLLAGVGLAIFFLGSGRWAIDGQRRSNKRRARLDG